MGALVNITIWHNVASATADDQHRRLGYSGYEHGHPLVAVAQYSEGVDHRLPSDYAAQAFHLFNVGDDPEFGTPDDRAVRYRKRHNRSLSVGDVVQVGSTWMACDKRGWREVDAPPFVIRHFHGSTAIPD